MRRYRLEVRGEIGPRTVRHLDAVEIVSTGPISVLVGRFADQADLYGVLNGLQELGIPLVSVVEIDPQ